MKQINLKKRLLPNLPYGLPGNTGTRLAIVSGPSPLRWNGKPTTEPRSMQNSNMLLIQKSFGIRKS